MLQRERTRIPNETIALPSGHKVSLRDFNNLFKSDNRSKNDGPAGPAVSSVAGSSSRFLPNYLKHRAKEKRRIESMEAEGRMEEERAIFNNQREERARAFEEQSSKKRDRRKRRKAQATSEPVKEAESQEEEHQGSQSQDEDAMRLVKHTYPVRTNSTIQILDEE